MSSARQVFADTETTGLDEKTGRVIEIGLIEYRNRKPTGVVFHVYLNPQMEIDAGATAIHGMTWDDLREQPLFSDVAAEMVEFVRGAELLAHNAEFDVKFLDAELARTGSPARIRDLCSVTDTMTLARQKHPGQRLNLNSLCEKHGVNNKGRELHGALLDASLLAEVYLSMTSGQNKLELTSRDSAANESFTQRLGVGNDPGPLLVLKPSPEELKAHHDRMAVISKKSGLPVWEGPTM